MSDMKPRLVGGFGEINFGKQYRQGNRIYDADAIAYMLSEERKVKKMGNVSTKNSQAGMVYSPGGVHLRYVLAHMDMPLDIL